MTDLIESLVRGLGLGGLYAVLGVSFVIVYRATGVINFATPALMALKASSLQRPVRRRCLATKPLRFIPKTNATSRLSARC